MATPGANHAYAAEGIGADRPAHGPTGYRVPGDGETWKLRGPIDSVEVYLKRNGLADEDFCTAITAEADALGARLRDGVRNLPDPNVLDIFDQVFVEQTPELAAQRDQFAAYLSSFEGAH